MRFITTFALLSTMAAGIVGSAAAPIDAAAAAPPGPMLFHAEAPTLDRWMYPFNFSAGARGEASTFGTLGEEGFDDRDGQIIVGFETADQITPALGACAYAITEATLTLMVQSNGTFMHDSTQDPLSSFFPIDDPEHAVDPDAGRPVEIFGVGFRNGFTSGTFEENSPFCNGCDCFNLMCIEVRNAFAIDFDAADTSRDVSNNVRHRFQPNPFGVGIVDGLPSGAPVPNRAMMRFTLDVSDERVQYYLRESIDTGRVLLAATSLHPTEIMGSGTFPVFYMKENLNVPATAEPAQLSLTVEVTGAPGNPDLTKDGVVNLFDLLELLSAWGACDCCPADLDASGAVNVFDLLELLSAWG